MRIAAPAKVNLHLGVHPGRDERGYHRVDSLMAAVDVCDWVDVEPAADTTVTCTPEAEFAQEQNTAYRAWVELAARVDGVGPVEVRIEKQIPSQAGLGGGSSDAGAVLRALCSMHGLSVADERVQAAARAVGADVPFFLDPVPTLLAGGGDVPVRAIERTGEIWVVLARAAGAGVSTVEAYACFDRTPVEPKDPEPMCAALERGDARAVGELLFNNLEHVARSLAPQVDDALDALRDCGEVLGATVCGSGSCCFAICETEDIARQCHARIALEHPDWWVRAARIWRSKDVRPTEPPIC